MLDRVSKPLLRITVLAGLGLVSLCAQNQSQPQAQTQPGQPGGKNWKDPAEYDLYVAITKEQDPNKRLGILNTWKEKYPASDYKAERLQIYLTTYAALNQPEKVLEQGNEALSTDPNNLTVLYLVTANTMRLPKPTPDQLSTGEKAANGLISNLDTFFANDKKPATTSDADWKKARTDVEQLAHTTLGWIHMQKKENEAAEQEFTKSLQINPNQAQVSYWLGTVIALQKKQERTPEALYHFARSLTIQGPLALTPEARKQTDEYLKKAYAGYHGQADSGLDQLKAEAAKQPFPPAGFKIKSVVDLKNEEVAKEEELKKTNPALALWLNVKTALTADNGEQYFQTQMKGTEVPNLRGKLISQSPATRPKELVLGISDPNTPEVTLRLSAPLPGKADPGTEIEFSGVPAEFAKNPFMVTFDVEKAKVKGWPGKEAAPVRRKTAARKRK